MDENWKRMFYLAAAMYQRFIGAALTRLVQARRDANLTQVEVARRLRKSHSFVSTWELGERRVDFVELQQLAQLYKKDLSFFADQTMLPTQGYL